MPGGVCAGIGGGLGRWKCMPVADAGGITLATRDIRAVIREERIHNAAPVPRPIGAAPALGQCPTAPDAAPGV
jgi:hypothetical protein